MHKTTRLLQENDSDSTKELCAQERGNQDEEHNNANVRRHGVPPEQRADQRRLDAYDRAILRARGRAAPAGRL